MLVRSPAEVVLIGRRFESRVTGEVRGINPLPLTNIETHIVRVLNDREWHPSAELETLLCSNGLVDGALAAGLVAQAIGAQHTLGYAIDENEVGAYQLQMEPSSG